VGARRECCLSFCSVQCLRPALCSATSRGRRFHITDGSRPNGAVSCIVLNDDAVATFFAEFQKNVMDVTFDGAGA
jgi:hypothetical protein